MVVVGGGGGGGKGAEGNKQWMREGSGGGAEGKTCNGGGREWEGMGEQR